jgi:hypothetical protein
LAGSVEMRSEDGRRVRRVFKAKANRDVLAKMPAAQDEAERGVPADDRTVTTREWLAWWGEREPAGHGVAEAADS